MTAVTEPTGSTEHTGATEHAATDPIHADIAVEQAHDEIAALTAERDAALLQVNTLKDEFLRAKAETENMRRRAVEDVQKAHKFAVENFAESLLPVKDSLEMALATTNVTPEQLLEGVQATLRQMTVAFERGKLLEIAPAAGEKFDPHKHQAIASIPADQEANTIVGLMQKGYQIADRTLRPALVTVAAAK